MSFNDFIIVLKEEIKYIEVDLVFFEKEKDKANEELVDNSKEIASTEEQLKHIQNELEKAKNDHTTTNSTKIYDIEEEIEKLKEVQRSNAHIEDTFGDLKTEKIESKIESPDDEELTEDDVKSQLMKLNENAFSLFSENVNGTNIIDKKNPILKFIDNSYNLKGIQFEEENKYDY